ncbi:Uncharacterised protein [Raoultella planticola]|uniref:Uncharacterized protein n=1 Tax=Raoultella planticola TaxID=575 RepID=A0A485CVL9_RAOPL|nr:Uncharacterised protein [Raoultella planticola]
MRRSRGRKSPEPPSSLWRSSRKPNHSTSKRGEGENRNRLAGQPPAASASAVGAARFIMHRANTTPSSTPERQATEDLRLKVTSVCQPQPACGCSTGRQPLPMATAAGMQGIPLRTGAATKISAGRRTRRRRGKVSLSSVWPSSAVAAARACPFSSTGSSGARGGIPVR